MSWWGALEPSSAWRGWAGESLLQVALRVLAGRVSSHVGAVASAPEVRAEGSICLCIWRAELCQVMERRAGIPYSSTGKELAPLDAAELCAHC